MLRLGWWLDGISHYLAIDWMVNLSVGHWLDGKSLCLAIDWLKHPATDWTAYLCFWSLIGWHIYSSARWLAGIFFYLVADWLTYLSTWSLIRWHISISARWFAGISISGCWLDGIAVSGRWLVGISVYLVADRLPYLSIRSLIGWHSCLSGRWLAGVSVYLDANWLEDLSSGRWLANWRWPTDKNNRFSRAAITCSWRHVNYGTVDKRLIPVGIDREMARDPLTIEQGLDYQGRKSIPNASSGSRPFSPSQLDESLLYPLMKMTEVHAYSIPLKFEARFKNFF